MTTSDYHAGWIPPDQHNAIVAIAKARERIATLVELRLKVAELHEESSGKTNEASVGAHMALTWVLATIDEAAR